MCRSSSGNGSEGGAAAGGSSPSPEQAQMAAAQRVQVGCGMHAGWVVCQCCASAALCSPGHDCMSHLTSLGPFLSRGGAVHAVLVLTFNNPAHLQAIFRLMDKRRYITAMDRPVIEEVGEHMGMGA